MTVTPNRDDPHPAGHPRASHCKHLTGGSPAALTDKPPTKSQATTFVDHLAVGDPVVHGQKQNPLDPP